MLRGSEKANQETEEKNIYAPCCNAPTQKKIEYAYCAKKCGAGAIMLLPGISGWDIVCYKQPF
jgi:ribulose-bisphosphate carboxylase large chain